jgi:hypothetical protein
MNRDDEEEEGEGERGWTTCRCGVLAEVDGVLPVDSAVELVAGGRAGRKKKKKMG